MNPDHRDHLEEARRLEDVSFIVLCKLIWNASSEPATTTTTRARTAEPIESQKIEESPDTLVRRNNVRDPTIPLGIYSPSGIDMIKILIRVKQRPNPKIDIGNVDSSCALLLCDLNRPDTPIVYCSEPFEVLTGYTSHEILGKNCRFLQSPDGKVEKGVKRKFTDDKTVFDLKTRISANEENQTTIVNYKKGGILFENILTTIPIRWDGNEIRYVVRFQVDRRKVDPTYFLGYMCTNASQADGA